MICDGVEGVTGVVMIDFLLQHADPWAYVLISALAAGESGLFLGFLLPGETAMIAGGLLAFARRIDLVVLMVVSSGAAIVGDSVGYWVGRRYGNRLRDTRLGRRVGDERWDKAYRHFRRRRGRAIVIGRFLGFVRPLVPAVSGTSGVPYPVFLAYDIVASIGWVVSSVLIGYLAGGSLDVAQRRAGNASLVLAAIVLLGIAVAWMARWVSKHRDELIAARDEFLARPPIAAFRGRFRSQLDFLRRRLDPAHRFGLFLTVSLLVAFAAGWLFLLLLEDVVGTDDVAVVDRLGVRFFAEHREPFLTDAMLAVTTIGGGAVVAAVMALAAIISFVTTRALKLPAFVALAMTGGFALVRIFKPLVGRGRPQLDPVHDVASPAFPSGHATWAAVLFATLAILLTRNRGWVPTVWIWAAAIFGAGMVALSRVYLGVHWPTDVLGGLALGGFWVAVSAAVVQGIRWDEEGPLRKRFAGGSSGQ